MATLVTLTQADEDTIKSDSVAFQTFIVDQIISKVKYYVGLTSAPDVPTMKNFVLSLTLQRNPNLPNTDPNLIAWVLIRMAVRGLNQKDTSVGGTLTSQIIAYLSGSGTPIGYIIDDWFVEQTKAF